jgi:hypothetical protein
LETSAPLPGAPTSRSLAGGMDAPPAQERFAGPAHYIFYFSPFSFFLSVFLIMNNFKF